VPAPSSGFQDAYLKGNAKWTNPINNTARGSLGWVSSNAGSTLITANTLAYWDGRYQDNNDASNLKYYQGGQLGVASVGNNTDIPTGAAILSHLNASSGNYYGGPSTENDIAEAQKDKLYYKRLAVYPNTQAGYSYGDIVSCKSLSIPNAVKGKGDCLVIITVAIDNKGYKSISAANQAGADPYSVNQIPVGTLVFGIHSQDTSLGGMPFYWNLEGKPSSLTFSYTYPAVNVPSTIHLLARSLNKTPFKDINNNNITNFSFMYTFSYIIL